MQCAVTRGGNKMVSPNDLERKGEGQGYHWKGNSGKIQDLSKEVSLFTLERYSNAFKYGIFHVVHRIFRRKPSL